MRSFGKENNKPFFEGGSSSTLLNKLNIQNKKIEKKPSYGRGEKIYTRNCLDEQYVTTNEYFSREKRYFEEFPKKWKRGRKRSYKEVISYYKQNGNYLNSPHHSRDTSLISSKVNVDEYAKELGKVYFSENKNVDSIRERLENETRDATSLLINSDLRNICTEERMEKLCKQQFVGNALLNLFSNIGKEAINLYGILKPSLTEVNMRKTIIQNIRDVCGFSYSKYHLVVFGSCNTDLDMYNSDIDVCIYTNRNVSEKREVNYLYGQLRSSPEFKSAHIKMICGANVPIIKCVFYNTGLSVDISFNRLSSIVSTIEIQKCLEKNKLLHYIITFFKVLLIENNLNDASKGGLSSYRFFLILKQFLQNTSFVFTEEQPCLYIGEVIYKFTAFISMFKDKPGLVAFLQSRKGEPPLSPFFKYKERKIRDGGDGDGDDNGNENGDNKESLPKFYITSDKTVQEMFLQLDVPACESVPTGKIKFTKILDARNCFKILYYRMIDWISTNIKSTNEEAYSEYKDLIFRENCETIAFLNILGEKYIDENLKQLYKTGCLFWDVKKELKSPKGIASDKGKERTSDDKGESCNNRIANKRSDLHKNRCSDAVCISSREKGTDLEPRNNPDAENTKKKICVKEYNTADTHSVVSKRSEDTTAESAFQKKGSSTDAKYVGQKCDSAWMCKSCHSAEQFDKKVGQLVLMLERHLNGGNSLSDDDSEQMKTPKTLDKVTNTQQEKNKREELSEMKSGVRNKGIKRGRDAISPTREEQWLCNNKNKMNNNDPLCSINNNSNGSSSNSKTSSGDRKNLKEIKLVNSYDCKEAKCKAKENLESIREKMNFLSWLYSEGSINTSENINMGKEGQDYFTLKMSRFNILYRIHKTTDNVSKLFCNRLHVLSDFFDVKHIIGERFNYYLQHKNQYENVEFRMYSGSEVEKIKQKTMSELAAMKQYDIHTISEFKMNSNFLI